MSGTTSQQQITRLYDTVFDRAPDSAGLAFWTNALNSGVTLDAVADVFVASAEFQSRGSLTNTDFVNLLYRNGLEREAEPAGRDFWTGGLQRNATDRGDVAVDISESVEGVASPLTRGTAQQGTGTAGTGATATATGQQGTGTTAAGTAGTGTTAAGTTGTGQQGTDAQTSGQQNTSNQGAGDQAAGDQGAGDQAAGAGTQASVGQQGAGQQGTDGAGAAGTGQQAGDSGQGSGQQEATAAGGDASSAAGASDDSAFVEVFRIPDGSFQTVTVVGDPLPVGSEVVDIRPATAEDTSDAVVFFDAPEATQEIAPLSDDLFA